MFRRKRSSSQHQPLASPSQTAHSAASHAFLTSQPSSSSLSSAAAAAALRSLTPTPQPIENVQTKRIQRRASVASQPNRRAGQSPTLRRASSSSSMTNRTFRRDQSPRRPATSQSHLLNGDAPPLPSLPSGYTSPKPVSPAARRSVSVAPTMRTKSPPPRASTRGVSVGPAVTRSPPRGHVNGLGTVHELERSASRNSINFSYPMSSRPNSPSLPPSPQYQRQVPTSLAEQFSPSESPVSKTANKPRTRGAAAEKRQSTGAQPSVGTAVAAAQAAIVPGATGSREQAPAPSRPAMIKRPSTVPEDHQGEERAEAGTSSITIGEQNRSRGPVTPDPQITKSPPTRERLNSPPFSQIASPASSRSAELEREPGKQSRVRQPSASPGLSARFSTQLSVVGAGELHHPPPRSVSPVKSAMKHSSRGSLSPDRAGSIFRPAPPPSELSDGTSVGSDEGYRARRKPVKVSFDDEAEIMGVAASPPTSPEDMHPPESPPGRSKSKTAFFGLGKRKPTTLDNAVGNDEFNEVLKPRPALPSFGSIRATRNTDNELPQPTQDELSDNESIASLTSNMMVSGWSFSNDHALGGILANAPQPENATNLTEKIEHPPMPAKTSENGNVDEVSEFVPKIRPAWVNGMQAAEFVPKPKQQDSVPVTAVSTAVAAVDTNLAPAITVGSASPELEKGRSSLEGYDVPGGFPRTSLEFIDPKTATEVTTPAPPTPPPGKKKVKKKSHNRSGSGSTVVFDESGTPIPTSKGTEDDSGESVYSDAAEDFEGDGFGSINAIVDGRAAEETEQPMGTLDRAKPAGTELPRVPEEPQQMIGRAVSPPQDSLPWVPDSPDTVDEPLPFFSPYPPFPVKRKPTNKPRPVSGVVTRPNITANKGQRPVSAVAFTPEATKGVPRPRAGPERKRPVSMGPGLTNGKGLGREASTQRPMTGASDSSGSFQRPEAGSPNGKGHTMLRTMRAHSQEPPKVQFSPSQQGLPEESRPMSSGSMMGRMSAMPTTLRGTGPNKSGKTSFFSTGKSPNRKKLSRSPGALFSSPSRFEDSDGEEDDGPMRTFRSRFADSSDEDEPGPNNTLRPVRGIPRRHGMQDGESTELEDSSDEERRRPGTSAIVPARNLSSPGPVDATGMAAVARSRGMSRDELEDFLHQSSRKPGILNRLNLRKGRNPEPKHRKMASEPVPENPALNHQRGGSVTTTVTSNNSDIQPTDIKSQRRGSRLLDGWPLRHDRKGVSEADGGAGADAITTASGAVPLPEEQPQINGNEGGNRDIPGAEANEAAGPGEHETGEGSHFKRQHTLARDVVIAGSGRKKRFPKLRKLLFL